MLLVILGLDSVTRIGKDFSFGLMEVESILQTGPKGHLVHTMVTVFLC
ncbi:hypothetical protein NXF25_019579 [Crotalus adamanteus]|uniref:Uncharacterized protein n=1 Tax=Crotalus adamanteus TaxID=8729 RepID=A0AAW1B2J5_CROAD